MPLGKLLDLIILDLSDNDKSGRAAAKSGSSDRIKRI
eukprot:SAG22_NODE_14469_length_374_cov_0.745455_2_plen_36_part_01